MAVLSEIWGTSDVAPLEASEDLSTSDANLREKRGASGVLMKDRELDNNESMVSQLSDSDRIGGV